MANAASIPDQNFRDFFLKSPVGRMIVEVGADGLYRCIDVNDAAAACFDVPREKMLGRGPEELFDTLFADQFLQTLKQCITSRKSITFNALPRVESGAVRMQGLILNPIIEDNTVRYVDIILRPDISDSAQLQRERDDALALMTSLFDASGLGIIVTDHHGRIVRLNDTFLAEYGWKREELLGEDFLRLVPPEDHLLSKKLHAAFISRGRQGAREVQLLRRDGSVADIILTTTLLELSQRRRFMVSTVRDVTERRNMVRNLKRAKEEADTANRAKSSFLANMSHELRTPLNAIIGFSELMKNQVFGPINNPKYEEYMTDIYFSSRHLLDIINDVLDMSKIEAGRVELVESEVSIPDLFTSVMRIMGDRARVASISLDFQADESLPNLRGDQRLLRQVLINLVSNAVKFSSAGKTVRLRAKLLGDNRIRMTVEDEGCGIPADKIKIVQEPFGQVNDPRHYKGQGTGLGLPLAKAMLELHGGRLTLESREGFGTTVALDLPPDRTLPIR